MQWAVKELDVLRIKSSIVEILQNNDLSEIAKDAIGVDTLILKLEIKRGTITISNKREKRVRGKA